MRDRLREVLERDRALLDAQRTFVEPQSGTRMRPPPAARRDATPSRADATPSRAETPPGRTDAARSRVDSVPGRAAVAQGRAEAARSRAESERSRAESERSRAEAALELDTVLAQLDAALAQDAALPRAPGRGPQRESAQSTGLAQASVARESGPADETAEAGVLSVALGARLADEIEVAPVSDVPASEVPAVAEVPLAAALVFDWIAEELGELSDASSAPLKLAPELAPTIQALADPAPPEPPAADSSGRAGGTTGGPLREPIRTLTMARLLAGHGYRARALSIYEELLRSAPADAVLLREVADLRGAASGQKGT